MSDEDMKETSPLCPLCTPMGADGERPTPGMLRIAVGSAHRSVECWLCHGSGLVTPQMYSDWVRGGASKKPPTSK
jgi:hypothetical protein